jgi:hypothetical protein
MESCLTRRGFLSLTESAESCARALAFTPKDSSRGLENAGGVVRRYMSVGPHAFPVRAASVQSMPIMYLPC